MQGSTNVETHLYITRMYANVLVVIFCIICVSSYFFVLIFELSSSKHRENLIQKRTHGKIQALSSKARDNFLECTSDKQTHAIVKQWTCKCDLRFTLWEVFCD